MRRHRASRPQSRHAFGGPGLDIQRELRGEHDVGARRGAGKRQVEHADGRDTRREPASAHRETRAPAA